MICPKSSRSTEPTARPLAFSALASSTFVRAERSMTSNPAALDH
jgi:hypothetical protein